MQIKYEKDVSVQINIWVTFHINNTQIVNEWDRETEREEPDTTWENRIRLHGMALCVVLCCVVCGMAWRGVGDILYIYQIQIEMENIRGITANHPVFSPFMHVFFLDTSHSTTLLSSHLKIWRIYMFINMNLEKGDFYLGMLHTFTSAYWIDGMKFFGHITYRHKTKLKQTLAHTHHDSETKRKKWWMCCNQTCNGRHANVQQNTRKLVHGVLFLWFYSFVWGIINWTVCAQN